MTLSRLGGEGIHNYTPRVGASRKPGSTSSTWSCLLPAESAAAILREVSTLGSVEGRSRKMVAEEQASKDTVGLQDVAGKTGLQATSVR